MVKINSVVAKLRRHIAKAEGMGAITFSYANKRRKLTASHGIPDLEKTMNEIDAKIKAKKEKKAQGRKHKKYTDKAEDLDDPDVFDVFDIKQDKKKTKTKKIEKNMFINFFIFFFNIKLIWSIFNFFLIIFVFKIIMFL